MQDMMWPRQDANIMDYGKESLYKFNLKCSGNVSENFSKFGDVFFKAAHVITEYILERQRIGELDCYFFPVAYLYRHSLELLLLLNILKIREKYLLKKLFIILLKF